MIHYKDSLWTVPVLWTNQMPRQQPTTTIQTEDLVTVLFTATSANFTKEDKLALRERAQHFTCRDGELYYVRGVLSIKVCIHVKQ